MPDVRLRRQLTLFVSDPARATLEAIRARLDPVQHRLIPAHVTLCREDELAAYSVDELGARCREVRPAPITLTFGAPEPFDGHGVLLPCIAGQPEFQRLRVALLGTDQIRAHRPHITLAHPRNPRAPENLPATWASLNTPITMTLTRLALIEQHGASAWETLFEIVLST